MAIHCAAQLGMAAVWSAVSAISLVLDTPRLVREVIELHHAAHAIVPRLDHRPPVLLVRDRRAPRADAQKERALMLVDLHVGILEQPMGVACRFPLGQDASTGLDGLRGNCVHFLNENIPMLIEKH